MKKEQLTKVIAVKKILKKTLLKQAGWGLIYTMIENDYPQYATSTCWQEGLRGVVYREIRYGRNFTFAEKGIIALRSEDFKV